jgi:hypothetical protein
VSCLTAEREILRTIYAQILENHLSTFEKSVQELAGRIVAATTTVFWGVATSAQFMPTARKFHYQFNLRDFSKIVQNLCVTTANNYRGDAMGMIRLWAHECHRVWLDRLLFDEDREAYMGFMKNAIKEFGENANEEAIFAEPLLYTSYVAACKGHEAALLPVKAMDDLKQVLEAKLEEYNEQVASMNLVLFDVAMEHVSRIARIVDLPVGSALLVGVGGSGKQSLAKLSAFLLGYDVIRIVVTSNYNMGDLKTDIQTMFTKAGVLETNFSSSLPMVRSPKIDSWCTSTICSRQDGSPNSSHLMSSTVSSVRSEERPRVPASRTLLISSSSSSSTKPGRTFTWLWLSHPSVTLSDSEQECSQVSSTVLLSIGSMSGHELL